MPDSLYTAIAHITPRPPFDFDKTLDAIRGFSPTYGEQTISDGVLTKAIRLNGQTIVFSAQSSGSTEAPQLQITLYSAAPISEELRQKTVEQIAFYMSTEDDLLPFYALAKTDPVFAPIAEKFYGYHQSKFLTPFESACWAILSSRNRRASASKSKQRLIVAYGDKINLNGVPYNAFPEAADLLVASPEDLLIAVRQQYRADFLRSVIWAFAHVDDQWLKNAPYEEVYKWLREINGIGAWAAEFILLRALGRMERLAAPEMALMDIVSQRYAEPAAAKNTLKIAQHYGAYQGYWEHYLRIAARG